MKLVHAVLCRKNQLPSEVPLGERSRLALAAFGGECFTYDLSAPDVSGPWAPQAAAVAWDSFRRAVNHSRPAWWDWAMTPDGVPFRFSISKPADSVVSVMTAVTVRRSMEVCPTHKSWVGQALRLEWLQTAEGKSHPTLESVGMAARAASLTGLVAPDQVMVVSSWGPSRGLAKGQVADFAEAVCAYAASDMINGAQSGLPGGITEWVMPDGGRVPALMVGRR